ncbi:MAG: hypothetical protein WC341_12220 [Bacteroidales bacterium]|jgi:hypothetical protein
MDFIQWVAHDIMWVKTREMRIHAKQQLEIHGRDADRTVQPILTSGKSATSVAQELGIDANTGCISLFLYPKRGSLHERVFFKVSILWGKFSSFGTAFFCSKEEKSAPVRPFDGIMD